MPRSSSCLSERWGWRLVRWGRGTGQRCRSKLSRWGPARALRGEQDGSFTSSAVNLRCGALRVSREVTAVLWAMTAAGAGAAD